MILDYFRLTDRTAIVTGSGQGIGASIAIALAEVGADVVLAARRRGLLEETAKEVERCGRRALVCPCDINDGASQRQLVEQAAEEFGRVDVLVTSAGGGGMPGTPFLNETEDNLEQIFHHNVTSRFQLSRLVAPHMLRNGDGGAIVHLTSALSRVRDRGFLVSGTTNAAVAHMTRNLAAELAPRIRVNGIACGSVGSPTLLAALEDPGIRDALASATLMQRIGEPVDIALAALYLSSPASRWVSGKIFEIDGGQEECSLHFGLPDL
jgi:7-alpha-hydroxysteroid dehydrogenase